MRASVSIVVSVFVWLSGCQRHEDASVRGASPSEPLASLARAAANAPMPRPSAAVTGAQSEATAADPEGFVRTFTEFSAPTEDFISDNLISNETAYLDVASELARRSGGVYLGVGPEQNFSYIAIARPELA